MRYLVGCVCVLAFAALPLSAGAQVDEEAATAEPGVQKPGRPDLSGERYGYQPPSRSTGQAHSRLAGPRAGVGISSILVPGGVIMIASGAAIRSLQTTLFCPPDMPRCGNPSPPGRY